MRTKRFGNTKPSRATREKKAKNPQKPPLFEPSALRRGERRRLFVDKTASTSHKVRDSRGAVDVQRLQVR
jgi:hypothetical protein